MRRHGVAVDQVELAGGERYRGDLVVLNEVERRVQMLVRPGDALAVYVAAPELALASLFLEWDQAPGCSAAEVEHSLSGPIPVRRHHSAQAIRMCATDCLVIGFRSTDARAEEKRRPQLAHLHSAKIAISRRERRWAMVLGASFHPLAKVSSRP